MSNAVLIILRCDLGLEKKIRLALDASDEKYHTLEDAIKDATEELNVRRECVCLF
jgi:hypothetical protein